MPDLADYRIDVYDDAGTQQGVLTGTAAGGADRNSGFLEFSCVKRVNAPGLLTLSLRGDHPILSSLADKWQFELWRKPTGQAWVRELPGIFRAGQWRYTDRSSITLYCPGPNSLLGYRIANYPAGTSGKTMFLSQPGETVAKALVTYNLASLATTGNGRKRAGTNWPATQITVESDSAGGNSVDWYCFGQNVLESLQKLSLISGGDFDLVKTSPTAYEFRWYEGQLGTDRTATVKFSLALGNMGAPEYSESRTDEATVACVWGQGEGTAREYATRTGANYATGNDLEMFVNASDVTYGTDGLNDRGDTKLKEAEAKRTFRFSALQVPATLYGVHYYLGDLVGVANPANGTVYTQKVEAVIQGVESEGKTSIEIETVMP